MGRWQNYLHLLLICCLCSSLIGANVTQPTNQPLPIQPLLLQLSTEQPDKLLRVIVQTWATAPGVTPLVTQLGGVVTQDLSFIHAFVAELPAHTLPTLANAQGVKWVSLDAVVQSSATNALDLRIASSSDDVEEEGPEGVYLGPGGIYLNSTDLELMQDLEAPSSGTQLIGLRFNGLAIPQGASITNAYLRLRAIAPDAGNNNTSPANLTIVGQAADNATTFTTTRYNVSNRPRTAAAVQWLPGAWSAGTLYDSPNLAPIVQEIVNRAGWASGNSLALLIRCTDGIATAYCGSRSADSWDGNPATAPLLHIDWETAATPPPSSASTPIFTTWATSVGSTTPLGFTDGAAILDSGLGPNGSFGSGSNIKGAFGGFIAEATSGNAITKVEVVLRAYAPVPLDAGDDPKLAVYVGGSGSKTITVNHHVFDAYVGAASAGTVYVDITNLRTWRWADFDANLELLVDQSRFNAKDKIYYDAIGLRVTSAPGSDQSGDSGGDPSALTTLNTGSLGNVYDQVIRATDVWNTPNKLQGKGVTVAVVDSGVFKTKDLDKRVRSNVNFNLAYHDSADRYGHGTFVAGIIAGSGSQSSNKYMGVAPRADVLNVRVSDDQGAATEASVINALQWVFNNKTKYNIRAVNLSLNSTVAQSYHTSPLDAACEVLWFNGIVVVVSAGNNGGATLYPPANDPFVITVGATDDKGTLSTSDDGVAGFSAYGVTESGFFKPDLVAPGRNIIGLLPENDKLNMSATRSTNRIDKTYFKMSGTSMAAPMVSGGVALLLQDEPTLTPDQVKYRLLATANRNWPGYNPLLAGAGYLDAYAAVNGTTTTKANQNVPVSQLLWSNNQLLLWNTLTEGSVGWGAKGSDFWPSIAQNSALNNSVTWGSDYWEVMVGAADVAGSPALKTGDAIGATMPPTVAASSQRLFLPIVSR